MGDAKEKAGQMMENAKETVGNVTGKAEDTTQATGEELRAKVVEVTDDAISMDRAEDLAEHRAEETTEEE